MRIGQAGAQQVAGSIDMVEHRAAALVKESAELVDLCRKRLTVFHDLLDRLARRITLPFVSTQDLGGVGGGSRTNLRGSSLGIGDDPGGLSLRGVTKSRCSLFGLLPDPVSLTRGPTGAPRRKLFGFSNDLLSLSPSSTEHVGDFVFGVSALERKLDLQLIGAAFRVGHDPRCQRPVDINPLIGSGRQSIGHWPSVAFSLLRDLRSDRSLARL